MATNVLPTTADTGLHLSTTTTAAATPTKFTEGTTIVNVPPTPATPKSSSFEDEEDENTVEGSTATDFHPNSNNAQQAGEAIGSVTIQRNDKVVFQESSSSGVVVGNDKTALTMDAMDVIGIVIGEIKVKSKMDPYRFLVQRLGINNARQEGMLYILSHKEMRLADPEELTQFAATGSLHTSK